MAFVVACSWLAIVSKSGNVVGVKLLPLAILAVLLTGCTAFQKKSPPTNFDAPTARLDDAKTEASSISEALNESTTHLNADADSLDALVNEGRSLAPALADYWNRLAKAVQKVREDVPKSAADRQAALVTKIASVQQQVVALQKQNADLKAQLAKAQSNSKFLSGLDWFSLVCIGAFVAGVVLYFAMQELHALSVGLMVGGIAGVSVCRLYRQADELWFWAGCGLLVIIFAVLVYVVIKAVRDRNAKAKALKQVVTGTTIAVASLPPPQAALATMQLKGTQDQSTSNVVETIKQTIDPDMVRREVAKAAVVSALPAMTQATLATPRTLADDGTGNAAGEATVAAGAATVRGPVVGSG